jgi:hypothetical protein
MTLTCERSLLSNTVVDEIRSKVEEKHLHSSPVEPVPIDLALEDFWCGFDRLPRGVQAMTYWWRRRSDEAEFVRITLDQSLVRPSASALRRYASAHEWGHILCGHPGYFWAMWKEGARELSYLPPRDPRLERECDWVSAYALVPVESFVALHGEPRVEIARRLDVPPRLVDLRWDLFRRGGW